MTRHSFRGCAFAFCTALGFTATAAQAATVAGKLLHRDSTPAAGITVTLANNRGRSAPVQSDSNGSYILYNIPAGEYYVEVWVDPRTPRTEKVTVNEPSTIVPTEAVP